MKEKDLICSECGYVYPIKSNRNFVKIKGFKYVYCFRCGEFTKHQTIDSVEMSGKDRICKKLLKIK